MQKLLSASAQLVRSAYGLNRAQWRDAQRQWQRHISCQSRRPNLSLQTPHISRRHQSTTAAAGSSIRAYVYGTLTIATLGFGYLYFTDTRASVHQWLVVPTLRLLHSDAEDAHHKGVSYIKGMYDFGLHPRERGNKDEGLGDLKVEVFGHMLSNPIGTSAGIDKDAEIPDPLFALGPAIVEVGGVTPRPQEGNPKPRVFRLPSQNALINRYGLNSEGAEHVAMQLRERVRAYAYNNGLGLEPESERMVLDGEAGVPPGSLHQGKLLLVQVAKNKTTPDNDIASVANDYVSCVDHLAKYADVLVVNVSSPNTPGLRDLQATAPLTAILTAVVDAAKTTSRKTKPKVMVKVSPDEESESQIEGICSAVWSSGVDGVIVGNTTKKRPDPLPKGYIMPADEHKLLEEVGGYSGPQMFERTLNLVKRYRNKLDQGPMDDTPASPHLEPQAPKAAPAPSSSSSPAESSVERDAKHLKPLTPEADAESKQPLVKLPERHSDPSNTQLFEPSSVTSPATAVAPPPSPTAATPPPPSGAADVKPAPAPYPSIGHTGPPPATMPETPNGSLTPEKNKEFEPKVIFATGGITNGEQCLQILNAGASVCQVYTAMMYGGVGTVTRMKREMREAISDKKGKS
ncbi:FMN-linked oxidoreductase [Teratosphaeria nubilosa]|uniref:Dihydroorotate dehydrogenase (quinone), mitochondrial n=1 Tax=Teratosphaeria nubilosa TaxID=161662 RepID=A0A6G1LPD0_9PEZI|nr:FMN-linked oxidoreductase [Teratosphaeria nubilosa]